MKLYELSVLLHPDLEIDLEKPLTKVRSLITDNGGEIVKEENEGKRRLAYRINNEDFAVYVFMDIKLPAEAVRKVQNTLNITEEVIRFLLVTVDEKARAAQAESKQRESSREDRADAESEE
jgi:small subunit ribosomal protein S6